MTATIIFIKKGRWLLSKQHSCAPSRNGRFYKKKRYVEEQQWYALEAMQQLRKQNWECTDKRVSLDIELHGLTAPTDWDNIGIMTDALEGVAYDNDRQCFPVKVNWIKNKERKIVVTISDKI